MKVHPLEGLPLEQGLLHAAASDAIEHGASPFAGPRFHSLYDVNIPQVLYAEASTRGDVLPGGHGDGYARAHADGHLEHPFAGLDSLGTSMEDAQRAHLRDHIAMARAIYSATGSAGHGAGPAIGGHGDPFGHQYMSFLEQLMPGPAVYRDYKA